MQSPLQQGAAAGVLQRGDAFRRAISQCGMRGQGGFMKSAGNEFELAWVADDIAYGK